MSASALICLAPGSEETEAVTTIDLLVRGGVKVTTASVASDGSLTIVCSRGVKLLADAPLVEVADGDFDIIVLPGGIKCAECFRDSTLLVETVRQFHLSGRIVAAICAAPTILANLGFLDRRRAVCYPGMEELMGSAVVQKGAPVVADGHIITGEAAGSSFPFGLKLVEVLKGAEAARQVCHAVHYHG